MKYLPSISFSKLQASILTVALLSTSQAMADDYCASFIGSEDFETASAFTDEDKLERLQDLFRDRFVGHNCTNSEFSKIMRPLGFRLESSRTYPTDPPRLSAGVHYNRGTTFCKRAGLPLGIFYNCRGVAGFLFLDETIVDFKSFGSP